MRLKTLLTSLVLASPLLSWAGAVQISPAPLDLAGRFTLSAEPERVSLNRTTRLITSSAAITLTNSSDRAITGPLRILVRLSSEQPLKDVTVVGSQAPDEHSKGLRFLDITPQIGGGLAAGASVTFTLSLERPSGLVVSYQLEAQGRYNRDPLADALFDNLGVVGTPIAFDASPSSDPDGDLLSYEWNFGSGPAETTSQVSHAFASPGLQEVTLKVSDGRGGFNQRVFSVNIRPPGSIALARCRVLDAEGFPLGGVSISEKFSELPPVARGNDASSGYASLGGAPGTYVWRFDRGSYLPVWRQATLINRDINLLPDPWMTRAGTPVDFTPLAVLNVTSAGNSIVLNFPAGAFGSNGTGTLTPLSAPSLPFPLPYGWSPLSQFHWSATSPQLIPGTASLALSDSLDAEGDGVALVRFDEARLVWTVTQRILSSGNHVTVPFNGTGFYAVTVADSGFDLPRPVAGADLPAVTFFVSEATFGSTVGTLAPERSVASHDAPSVTSLATVDVSTSNGVPSGVYLPTTLEETYRLSDARVLRTPDLDRTIPGYHRPAPVSPASLRANFKLRPSFLFGPEDLTEAVVRAEVHAPSEFAGAVITTAGGVLAREGWRLAIGDGSVTRPTAAELRPLRLESFSKVFSGVGIVGAAELNLVDLTPDVSVWFDVQNLAPSANFVLARLTQTAGDFGLEPILRGATDAAGHFSSVEPVSGGLPGIRRGGILLLARVTAPLGLVSGSVTPQQGAPGPGLTVKVDGFPWLTTTDASGRYLLPIPLGSATLVAFDSRDSNEGRGTVTVADGNANQTLNLTIAPTGPRVVSTTPASGATGVAVVTAVRVRFSEVVTSASFGTTGLELRGPADAVIPSALSLNLAGTEAQLLPTDPLNAGIVYTIHVSPSLADSQGNALNGPSTFTFTTQPPEVRSESAQLLVYEPGAQAVPARILSQLVGYDPVADPSAIVVEGTAGVADPSVPVILINDNSGETATVISKVDGSFANFLHGSEEDLFSATFINANGTRISIPLTLQKFDDGRLGLYRQGGTIQAPWHGGPVKIVVEAQSVSNRTVFKAQCFTAEQTAALLEGVLPPVGSQVLGGLYLTTDGDASNAPAKITFPLPTSELTLPPDSNPAEAAFGLAVVRVINGVKVFEVVDRLTYADGSLQSTSTTFPGLNWGESELQFLTILKIANGNHAVVSGRVVTAVNGDRDPATGSHQALSGAAVFGGASTLPGNGILSPGSLVSISRENGAFSLLVPKSLFETNLLSLFAAANRFPGLFGRGTVQSTGTTDAFETIASGLVVYNRTAAGAAGSADTTVPTFSLTQTPDEPAVGGTAQLAFVSNDDRSTPVLNVAFHSAAAFANGVTIAASDVTLALQNQDNFPTSTRQSLAISCSKAGTVLLQVTATDVAGNTNTARVAVSFGVTAPSVVTPNPVDLTGPSLTSSLPANGATGVNRFAPLALTLSEPVSPAFLSAPEKFFLLTPSAGQPLTTLSTDGRTVSLAYPALQSGTTYSLFLGAGAGGGVRDLAGNVFDQVPGGAHDGFVLHFETQAVPFDSGLNVAGGAGAAGDANRLFLLDRGTASKGYLRAFNRDGTGSLQTVSTTELPAFPRDLIFIPKYDFVLGNGVRQKKDLVVIIGGYVSNPPLDGSVPPDRGPWIAVYDVDNLSLPAKLVTTYTSANSSAFLKLDWSAPHLGILEAAADTSKVLLVNLQLMIYCFNHEAEVNGLPVDPDVAYAGLDVNGDGDYVDAGERIPQPSRIIGRVGLYNGGLVRTLTLPAGDTRRLQDFSMGQGGSLVTGVLRGNTSQPSALRSLSVSGVAPAPAQAEISLGGAPRRILYLAGIPLQIPAASGPPTTRYANLALVTLAGSQNLSVYDVTNPLAPVLQSNVTLPLASGESLWSPRRASNGSLALASSKNLWFLDPAKLALPPVSGALPGLLGLTKGAGSPTRSFVSDGVNFYAVSFGGFTRVSK